MCGLYKKCGQYIRNISKNILLRPILFDKNPSKSSLSDINYDIGYLDFPKLHQNQPKNDNIFINNQILSNIGYVPKFVYFDVINQYYKSFFFEKKVKISLVYNKTNFKFAKKK